MFPMNGNVGGPGGKFLGRRAAMKYFNRNAMKLAGTNRAASGHGRMTSKMVKTCL